MPRVRKATPARAKFAHPPTSELEAFIAEAEAEEAAMAAITDVIHLPPSCLDEAPVNSKVVIVRQEGRSFPLLATPDGMRAVPPDDVCRILPEGAKVWKAGEGRYVSEQLSPVVGHPPKTYGTARAAVERFHADFHDARE